MEQHNLNISQKKQELEEKIADLKARLPAHSVKPEMMEELEKLEEELENLRQNVEPA